MLEVAFAFEGIGGGQALMPAPHDGQTCPLCVEDAVKLSDEIRRRVSADFAHGVVDVANAESVALKTAVGHDDALVDALHHSGQEFKRRRTGRG